MDAGKEHSGRGGRGDPPEEEDRALFGRLLDAAREAHARGHFDSAYHGLAAALDLARDIGDEPGMALVERVAGEQLAFIDTHASRYHHSTAESQKRGQSFSIFSTLARQAHVGASVVRSRRSVDEVRTP